MSVSLSNSLIARQWWENGLHISAPTRQGKSKKRAEKKKETEDQRKSKQGRGIKEVNKEKESNEELKRKGTKRWQIERKDKEKGREERSAGDETWKDQKKRERKWCLHHFLLKRGNEGRHRKCKWIQGSKTGVMDGIK